MKAAAKRTYGNLWKKDGLIIKQIIRVGKDRCLDDFRQFAEEGRSIFNMTDEERQEMRQLAKLLSLPDNSWRTIEQLFQHNYLNGEEVLFYKNEKVIYYA